eukprot:TRINITY_DN1539_c4_g1_i1.p1 TRINITY_DN1539_c4_g1~~TRINITY_DN1539_c4_g1_i1.p1  ORF type:complete len:212 (-),score=53.67 TRINITY_DN1539_c4_g1_i1:216-851(-)
MKQEIMIATKWIAENCIVTKDGISTETLERFESMIQRLLEEKYRGHWYETEPYRGQAFRALSADEHSIDKTIATAAEKSGLPEPERIFRRKWMIWVDPGEVEVKDEITNQRIVLYRKESMKPNSRSGRMSPTKMNVNSKQFVPSSFMSMPQNTNLLSTAVSYAHQNSQKTILRRPNGNTMGRYMDVNNDDVDYQDYRIPSPRESSSVSSQA